MSISPTVAVALVQALAESGVRRIYGLPGGGSSLDLIEAAAAHGIDFVLTRNENAAVMMAGAMAEVTGVPGVALTTKGPGLANAANGTAYASLDRAPVLVVTDGFTDAQRGYITHQVFDQAAMLAPVVKGRTRLAGADPGREIRDALALATALPQGPVHVELTGEVARRAVPGGLPPVVPAVAVALDSSALAAARALLDGARKPVVIVGMEARRHAGAVRRFAAMLDCPVLPTYKAKGVVPDADPRVTGVFTGGAQEAECVGQADLIVLVGLDPVELILQPWPYRIPVLELSAVRYPVHYVKPEVSVLGPLEAALDALAPREPAPGWTPAAISGLRAGVLETLAYGPVAEGVAPDRAVLRAARAYARHGVAPRITVDAGAHMFSAAAFFPCGDPGDLLISNGLATMAFALPAAIAAALDDPSRPALCMTGDGGLLMCLGELVTAVQQRARIVVMVFNDGALSLIDVKQQSRTLPPRGVRWDRTDFATTMRGCGGLGLLARSEAELDAALETALRADGPALIDVHVDAAGYGRQLKAMRG
jgi:acetolactate synthase-1/2/3 large subunit